MTSYNKQYLLHILEERDIPLGPNDVAGLFENAQTQGQVQSWMREFLNPSTLLTKEELDFSEGRDPSSANGTNGKRNISRPFCSDVDIDAAIRSLEASTAAIQVQCEVLESQKSALLQLRAQNTGELPSSASLDSQQRNLERQRAQVDFSIDELSQSLTERVKLATKQADSLTGNVASNADRLFDKDDRLLDGLQKLLPLLSRLPAQVNENVDVEKLCSILDDLSSKEIRARLNAVYVDSLARFGRQMNGSLEMELTPQQQKQRETLHAELTELSGEIDGLVGIVVDQRFRKPIKNTQSTAQADLLTQRSNWSEYMVTALQYLTARLEKVDDHVQHIHAHQAALRAISGSLDEVNAMQPPTPDSQGLPATRKSNSKGLKPLRLVQANLSEPQDPAIQLLRQLEIRTSDINGLEKPEEFLEPTLRERTEKSEHLSNTTERAITDAVVKSLSSTDEEIQSLLGAVHAYSKFNSIRLVDDVVTAGLQILENQTQRLGDEMRELDTEQLARSVKAKQAENLRSIAR